DVVYDLRELASSVRCRIVPGEVDVQGSTVVDQPQAPVPDEQVDIPGRSIDVRDQAVEPDDVGGESGIELGHRPERQGAGQKVESQVETGTALEQLLNFGIRLGRRERWVQLDQDDLGDGQAER